MRTALRFCLVVAWLVAALLPASGASVIFYSKTDNAYGWCAGYSYGRGESCAREQCLQYGSKCELAIECDGGWSATAFAPDPYEGFGASCEWQDARLARSIALLSCIYASHALCSTSEAFSGSASTTSESANAAYDLAWYTQSLLLTLGYDIGEVDGAIGSKTRAALKQFQAAAGLEPTGNADWEVMALMLYAAGGTARFVGDVIAETDSADQDTVLTYAYRYSAVPAPDVTLSGELAGFEDGWRRTALAALINYAQAPCTTVSAAGAAGIPESWSVSCAEGDYLLALGGPVPVVSRSDGPIDVKPIPVDCPVDGPGPGALKPSPVTLNDPGPAFKPSLNSENARGPAAVAVVDCPPPLAVTCPTDGPDPDPGKAYKPSLNTENSRGPASDDVKRSLLTPNSPPPALAPPPVDCIDQADQLFKPSGNTINSIASDLEADVGLNGE